MAVTIRLARAGSKKRPFYRIVAAEKRFPRDGRFVEQLGYYDPRAKVFNMERDRYTHWLKVGALPSDTVRTLTKKYKENTVKPGEKPNQKTPSTKATKV